MSQKQIQASESTCMSSIDQQQVKSQKQSDKTLTDPSTKKMNQEMKSKKEKGARKRTKSKSRSVKRKTKTNSKRVTFKGNGNVKDMVEIVNVESYKAHNLDLATSDCYVEEKVKSNCSCLVY